MLLYVCVILCSVRSHGIDDKRVTRRVISKDYTSSKQAEVHSDALQSRSFAANLDSGPRTPGISMSSQRNRQSGHRQRQRKSQKTKSTFLQHLKKELERKRESVMKDMCDLEDLVRAVLRKRENRRGSYFDLDKEGDISARARRLSRSLIDAIRNRKLNVLRNADLTKSAAAENFRGFSMLVWPILAEKYKRGEIPFPSNTSIAEIRRSLKKCTAEDVIAKSETIAEYEVWSHTYEVWSDRFVESDAVEAASSDKTFDAMDANQDGQVSRAEFIKGLRRGAAETRGRAGFLSLNGIQSLCTKYLWNTDPNIDPPAWRLAKTYGIPLSGVVGSGGGGKILLKDIEAKLTPAQMEDVKQRRLEEIDDEERFVDAAL